MNFTEEAIRNIPKVELHCHLDGSLSREYMQAHLGRPVAWEELRVSDDCGSLNEYLEKFELPGQCLRDEKGLADAGYDVLKTMSGENVCYAEIRFAPLFSAGEGFGVHQVLEALLRGLERGRKEFGIDYNVITCAMRHHSSEDNYQMIKAAYEFLGKGVCAADLAGAEALYPMSEFMELFGKVRRLDMPFTIHAGECGNAENIRDAAEAGAGRIGHGIAMRGNSEIKTLVSSRGIGVEMCPVSNFQTKAVTVPKEYPIREFLEAGIRVSVNTDNRTVSNTSLTRELMLIHDQYGINSEEVRLLMKNAVDTAFADDTIKEKLCRKLNTGTF